MPDFTFDILSQTVNLKMMMKFLEYLDFNVLSRKMI